MDGPHTEERRRLETLRALRILDTPSEPAFDRIVALAAGILRTPIALLSFVDEDREWFKAHVGIDLAQAGRAHSFCSHAVRTGEPLVVTDASRDPRFADHELVAGRAGIRFHVAVPVVVAGERVGALCVGDRASRPRPDDDGLGMLVELAALAGESLAPRLHVLDAIGADLQRYAAIVDSSNDAILSTSLDGTITSWNRGAERLYGYAAQEVIGRSAGLLFPEHRRHESADMIQRIRAGERIELEETERLTKDGRQVSVSVSVSPVLDPAGRTVGCSATAHDISARKRLLETESTARELERARDEAERASRMKSEFLSRVSHELRTPLNAVLGFAQLLEAEDLDEAQHESVRHISHGGRRLLALVEEVLDIVHIDSGELALSMEPVDAAQVVTRAIGSSAERARQRSIRVSAALDDDPWVLADRERLEHVVLHLLSNAIEYNRAEGEVVVTLARDAGGRVALGIADTGVGMSPEQLGRLFEPFDRLGAERMQVDGTGLGLALSSRLVEAMGGTLTAESTPGVGTTMRLELPGAARPAGP